MTDSRNKLEPYAYSTGVRPSKFGGWRSSTRWYNSTSKPGDLLPAVPGPQRRFVLSIMLAACATACSQSPLAPTVGDEPASVQIELSRLQLLLGGQTELVAEVRNSAGKLLPDASIQWTSSDESVVITHGKGTGNQKSENLGQGRGNSKVSAKSGGSQDSTVISVVDSSVVFGIRIVSSATRIEVGRTLQLLAEAVDENGTTVYGATFVWRSSDPDVAAVSSEGLLEGRSIGSVTVTVQYDRFEDRASYEVTPASNQSIPAFPGAEGYGALALNACRGLPVSVHRVTTTADSGPGSFYDIITNQLSDRYYDVVLFATGGTITVTRIPMISNACVYIAGQTAPGGGVQLRSPDDPMHTITTLAFDRYRGGHDVVIRYLRLRPGRGERDQADALGIASGYNIVVDHVSTAWGSDKSVMMHPVALQYGGQELDHVSVQWSMITTTLYPHSTGNPIGGDIDEPDVTNISIHHNAYIHNSHRNPLIKRVRCIEVVNNLVYNWKARVGRSYGNTCIDYVGNYYRPGPLSNIYDVLQHEIRLTDPDPTKYFAEDPILYMSGNVAEHRPGSTQEDLVKYVNDRTGPLPASAFVYSRLAAPSVPVTATSAEAAYNQVLESAGAVAKLTCDGQWVDSRDTLDRLLIEQVKDRNGPTTTEESDHQQDYGGYPSLSTGTACSDGDGDGMPDDFEQRWNLNPADDFDAAVDRDGDGYLNIEEYLNGQAP